MNNFHIKQNYDATGNLLSDSSAVYEYDAFNRNVKAETVGQKIRYIRMHEILASDAENARTYYHYASDEMGNITHVVGDGHVLNRYAYDAWGIPEAEEETVQNRFLLNGQQYDVITRQYYLRARFYNILRNVRMLALEVDYEKYRDACKAVSESVRYGLR